MTEYNDHCNVGTENFPSNQEHEQNDEKKVSYVTLLLTCFIILKLTMITNTTNELIVNRSRKREK